MSISRKTVFFVIGGIIVAYFLKKEIEKKAVSNYIKTTGKPEMEKKLDQIKINVLGLIEKFHYKYKSPEMTVEDIDNYEKIINEHIVK